MATNLGEFRIAKKSVSEPVTPVEEFIPASIATKNKLKDVRKSSSEEFNWKAMGRKSVPEQMPSSPLLSHRVKRANTEPPFRYILTREETDGPKPESKSKEKGSSTDDEKESKERLENGRSKHPKLIRMETLRPSSSDSEASSKEDATQTPRCNVDHSDGRKVADFTVPTDAFTLFTAIFTNSQFIKAFHTRRETADMNFGDWIEDGTQTVRTNTYTVKLTQMMGPKCAKVKEKQTLLPVSKPGFLYAVNMESNNSEVQYADSFYMTFHMCLTRIAEKETHIVVVADIKYRKAVWGPIKSFIEKAGWGGMANFYEDLETSLKKEFSEAKIDDRLPTAETSKLNTSKLRRHPLRKKRPAPSIPVLRSVATAENATENRFLKFLRQNPLKSEVVLKVLICFLAIILLGFNAFLFIKVQELETEIELNYSKPGFIRFDTSLQSGNIDIDHLQELFNKQESLRYFTQSKLVEPIGMAIEQLKQVEAEIHSIRNLVNLNSS